MAKTKFVNAQTVVTSDFLNSIFGGLTTADGVPATDPRVAGHIHDGTDEDGHVGKIDLVEHVEGELQNANLADNAVSTAKIQDASVTQAKLDPSISLGSDFTLTPERGILSMTNTFPLQLGVDAGGNITGVPDTITFEPAPSDILIKHIAGSTLGYNQSADLLENFDPVLFVQEIRVNGSPIDSAGGAQLNVYSVYRFNPVEFNIPLEQGDVIEFDISGQAESISAFSLTYEDLPDTLDSGINSFLGSTSLVTLLPAGTDDAEAILTVTSGSLSSEILLISRWLANTDSLQGAGGPRTPGDDDFDNTLATSDLIAADIADAINDPLNSFTYLSASAVGSDVTLTFANSGHVGNLTRITNGYDGIGIEAPDFFSGGSPGAVTTITFEPAPSDCTLKYLVIKGLAEESVEVSFEWAVSVEALRINGGSNLIGGGVPASLFSSNGSRYSPNLGIELSAGDVVTIDVVNSFIPAAFLFSAVIELP